MFTLEKADLWELYDQGHWVAIPVNCVIKANGRLVMGKGVALQAATRFPDLDLRFGEAMKRVKRVYGLLELRLVAFPTKYHYRYPADTGLIRDSAEQLAGMLTLYPSLHQDKAFILPAPGLGEGQLTWPIVEPRLKPLYNLNVRIVVKP